MAANDEFLTGVIVGLMMANRRVAIMQAVQPVPVDPVVGVTLLFEGGRWYATDDGRTAQGYVEILGGQLRINDMISAGLPLMMTETRLQVVT